MDPRKYMDLFMGMFHYFPKGRKRFHRDNPRMARFFKEQQGQYSLLLGDMLFLNDTRGCWSPTVRDALDHLRMAGVLVHGAPTSPREYIGGYRQSEKALGRLPNSEKVEELSDKFQDEFRVP